MTWRAANEFVKQHHRHSLPTQGCKFAVGCIKGGELVGVGVAGRPVAKELDDGDTLEVTRVCTVGTKNACTFLYARCINIGIEMGYQLIITYTLATESGHSVRLAMRTKEPPVFCPGNGYGWDRPSRPRARRLNPPRNMWVLFRVKVPVAVSA